MGFRNLFYLLGARQNYNFDMDSFREGSYAFNFRFLYPTLCIIDSFVILYHRRTFIF